MTNVEWRLHPCWFGTPRTGKGGRSQSFQQASLAQASDSWARNPGGGFGLPIGTNWGMLSAATTFREASMGINGAAVPEPATMAILGLGVAALARRRARK